MGQQFLNTRPSQSLATVDPFWHHEIAALESHNSRKLVVRVPVQSHHELNVRNQYGTIRRNIDSDMLPKRKNGQRQQKVSRICLHSAETDTFWQAFGRPEGGKLRAFRADSRSFVTFFGSSDCSRTPMMLASFLILATSKRESPVARSGSNPGPPKWKWKNPRSSV